MKKVLTLLILGCLFGHTQAQIIFSENFDDGTLGTMTAVDVDGKIIDANAAARGAGPTFQPVQASLTNWRS